MIHCNGERRYTYFLRCLIASSSIMLMGFRAGGGLGADTASLAGTDVFDSFFPARMAAINSDRASSPAKRDSGAA